MVAISRVPNSDRTLVTTSTHHHYLTTPPPHYLTTSPPHHHTSPPPQVPTTPLLASALPKQFNLETNATKSKADTSQSLDSFNTNYFCSNIRYSSIIIISFWFFSLIAVVRRRRKIIFKVGQLQIVLTWWPYWGALESLKIGLLPRALGPNLIRWSGDKWGGGCRGYLVKILQICRAPWLSVFGGMGGLSLAAGCCEPQQSRGGGQLTLL